MPDVYDQIAALVRKGRKIEAVKLLREATGASLAEAKAEIDRLSASLTAESAPAGPDGRAALDDEVIALVEGGRKIEAVKLVRERMGVGLKEAKGYVDGVTGSSGGSGCASGVLLLLALASLLLALG